VRLADWRRHDPLARGRIGGTGTDELDDIVVRAGIGDVHQRFGEGAEVHQVRMGIDEAGQDRRAVHVDLLGAPARDPDHRVAGAHRCDPPLAQDDRVGGCRRPVTDQHPTAHVDRVRHRVIRDFQFQL
jgi:hypothetical protein